MTLSEDEIRSVETILRQREPISSEEVVALVQTKGFPPNFDAPIRCKAFVAVMRSLLRDQDIKNLLGALRERTYLKVVVDELERDARVMGPDPANTLAKMREAERKVEVEINGLYESVAGKIGLLVGVAKTLRSLKCEDHFEFPGTEVRLPSW